MAERKGEHIYVRNEAGGLEPLMEERFDSEDELQALLARHPELLDGKQMRPGDPRRWILITREQGIADTADAPARWALDHLIIDQDATPTLVEVKRGANSEVRRTVVGQMLDYAAHAPKVWTVDELRRTFEARDDHEERLADLLRDEAEEPDADEFWRRVTTNLDASRLRLLFVADAIPDELAAVVKFLNEQMPTIEVLAVEIKQFRGETLQTLVPRVIGRLEKQDVPGGSPRSKKLTRELLFEELEDHVHGAATRWLDVAKACDGRLKWGASSVTIRVTSADGNRYPIALIYRPSAAGVSGERHFVFGNSSTEPTGELRAFLDEWTNQFGSDEFTERTPWYRWSVSYEDAVANIDLLADRLRTALTEIPKLSNDA